MIKSVFKRAWLSITRKPSKTVILGIVMFVMANLVLASIAIKNAVNESTRFAKESLGSTVYLTADMDKLRQEAEANAQQDSNGGMRVRITRPTIYVDMVKEIGDSSYIKDYTYGINATAEESGFEAIENNASAGGPSLSTNVRGVINLYGNMSIIGINSYAFIDEVQNKSMEIVDGTYFDENSGNGVIISNDLAAENEINVGDKIKLINKEVDIENYDPRNGGEPEVLSSKTYEVEVIGIYEVDTDNFNANTIYMNVEAAAQFLKAEDYNEGNYGVDNIEYYLNNPEDSEAFIAQAEGKYPNLADEKLMLNINNDAYEQMAGPIEAVGSFADTVLWIVVIASILIIALIINNNIKDRKYEIGVLMSLGGTKKNVISGFLFELLIIGTLGFALSIGTSYFLANSMGKALLEKQINMAEDQSENNFGRPGAGGRGGGFTIAGPMSESAGSANAIDTIDISVGINDYVVLFAIGYLIAGVAMIIPSMNIVKYEPKTILTGRS